MLRIFVANRFRAPSDSMKGTSRINEKGVPESNWMQKETKSHIAALRTNQYYAYAFDHNPKRLRIYAGLLRKNGALDVIVDETEFELKWKGPELPDPDLF